MKKYELTKEHEAQLKPWADMWIKRIMRTEPMTDEDRRIMRESIKGLYEAADLTPPPPERIIFVPSPFIGSFAAGFAAAVWHNRKTGQATEEATADATEQATEAATWRATGLATGRATEATTEEATQLATRAATSGATWQAANSWYYVPLEVMIDVSNALGLGEFGLRCAEQTYKMANGGNHFGQYASFLSFFHRIVKLPIDYSRWQHYENAAIHGSWRWIHKEFCIVSDFPTKLMADNENRPHCDDGPFCQWSDGSALYSVHGVRVPMWVVERPEEITVQSIDTEKNAEVRRVMINRYKGDYFDDCGASLIQEDKWGKLYKKERQDDSPIVFVRVKNSTPEPDGSIKEYTLRVPPTIKTALEAVAWTHEQSPEDYSKIQQMS